MGSLSVLEQEWFERLKRFYDKYQPEKSSSIDGLLQKVNNNPKNFEKLLGQLVNKYGPEPEIVYSNSSGEDHEAAEVDSDEGNNETATNQQLFDRILAFYDHYNKEKMSSVGDLVNRTKQNPKYERKLIRMLVKKYGPEPDAQIASLTCAMNSLGTRAKVEEELEDIRPLKRVVYCPVDGMPPEFSEYLPTFPQALPWLLENYPNLKLATKKGKTVKELVVELEENGDELEVKSSRGGAARPNKTLAGKKKEGSGGNVVIEVISRGKRKHISQIVGLDEYDGIKLKEAAKKLGKKFACAASVNKLPEGKKAIDLQGDWSYELPQIILEFFSQVPQEAIYQKKGAKKVKAF